MANFTLADALGTLKACFALLPFMLAPGYVFGWLLNLFEFRRRRLILRLILALPLSIAICPMLSYVIARFLPSTLSVFYIGVSIAGLALLIHDVRWPTTWSKRKISRETLTAVIVVSLWGALALAEVVDLQIGNQLYPPIMAYDHSVRTAMTASIARHIPPGNPFFAGAPLRYHYLWLLFCSLPMKFFSLSPRHIVNSGVLWCGLSLICVVALGLKFLLGVQAQIQRKTLLAVGLLCITGLDILPSLYLGFARGLWLGDMEWWNDVQITSWAGSALFVPHNLAALIACFVAFLLLRYKADAHRCWVTGPVIVAGMAFASAAGMSVYVTFTFVVVVLLWLLTLITRKDWLEAGMFVVSGIVALLWGFSFLYSLRGTGGGGAFAEFALRPFSLGIALVQQAGVRLDTPFAVTLANAIFLPLNYTLELGFFLLVGILRLRQLMHRQIQANNNERAAWTMVAASFLVGTFLRSSTLSSNDLGWRCFLPAQFVLLLWATALLDRWWFPASDGKAQAALSGWTKTALAALLILGALGTAYQVFMLRMFPVLVDRGTITGPGWVVPHRHFGERAKALRSAYQALDAQLPSSAVFQDNPDSGDLILRMLYSGHDEAAGNSECGTIFGGDAGICAQRVRNLRALFSLPDGAALDATCHEYGIDALVVQDADPVWRLPGSWVWKRNPSLANDYVRAFRCGGQ